MKDVLDDYIGASPATSIDVDTIMARGRGVRRRRRVAAAGAALCAIALTGAAGAWLRPESPAVPAAPDARTAEVRTVLARVAPQVGGLETLVPWGFRCAGELDEATTVKACPQGVAPREAVREWRGHVTYPRGAADVEVIMGLGDAGLTGRPGVRTGPAGELYEDTGGMFLLDRPDGTILSVTETLPDGGRPDPGAFTTEQLLEFARAMGMYG